MAQTNRAASGNSTTAQQVNDMLDAGNVPGVDFAVSAATSGLRHAVLRYIGNYARTIGGLTETRANAIADALMAKGLTPAMLAAAQKAGTPLPVLLKSIMASDLALKSSTYSPGGGGPR
jgi:hypothetical protein